MYSNYKNATSFPICLLVLGQLFFLSSFAIASTPIGSVKTYEPTAKVIRQGKEEDVSKGTKVYAGDTLVTDADGTVGIIFDDGSVLTLGPDGMITLEDFMFKPAEKEVSFVTKIAKGTLAFLSGTIGKIKPGSVQFKTPTATLGLRGTKVLIEVK